MSGSLAATYSQEETSMRATADLAGWCLEVTDRALSVKASLSSQTCLWSSSYVGRVLQLRW